MPSPATDINKLPDDRSQEMTARQAGLEDAARIVRRLANDFGNILTGISGFTELNLSLLSPNSPAYRYTAEIHRAARQGAEFTQALRWFSRRGVAKDESSLLAEALDGEFGRLRRESPEAVVVLCPEVNNFPPLAMDSEGLRQVLRQVLRRGCRPGQLHGGRQRQIPIGTVRRSHAAHQRRRSRPPTSTCCPSPSGPKGCCAPCAPRWNAGLRAIQGPTAVCASLFTRLHPRFVERRFVC
jgi:hypothetical protein